MSDTAEFPLPADATPDERAAARSGIARHARVVEETPSAIRFAGRQIGRTGPIRTFQYTRLYEVEGGFIAAGHDLRAGIHVAFADAVTGLPAAFDDADVREFVADELRFRGLVAGPLAAERHPDQG